jgi:hypothetical protein
LDCTADEGMKGQVEKIKRGRRERSPPWCRWVEAIVVPL